VAVFVAVDSKPCCALPGAYRCICQKDGLRTKRRHKAGVLKSRRQDQTGDRSENIRGVSMACRATWCCWSRLRHDAKLRTGITELVEGLCAGH